MRFKLDENFGTRTQHIFEASGHDIMTVRQEALQGASDITLFEVCSQEQRCLVTLDLDFVMSRAFALFGLQALSLFGCRVRVIQACRCWRA